MIQIQNTMIDIENDETFFLYIFLADRKVSSSSESSRREEISRSSNQQQPSPQPQPQSIQQEQPQRQAQQRAPTTSYEQAHKTSGPSNSHHYQQQQQSQMAQVENYCELKCSVCTANNYSVHFCYIIMLTGAKVL